MTTNVNRTLVVIGICALLIGALLPLTALALSPALPPPPPPPPQGSGGSGSAGRVTGAIGQALLKGLGGDSGSDDSPQPDDPGEAPAFEP